MGSQTTAEGEQPSVTGLKNQRSSLQLSSATDVDTRHKGGSAGSGSLRWKELNHLEQRHLLLFASHALGPPLPLQQDG